MLKSHLNSYLDVHCLCLWLLYDLIEYCVVISLLTIWIFNLSITENCLLNIIRNHFCILCGSQTFWMLVWKWQNSKIKQFICIVYIFWSLKLLLIYIFNVVCFRKMHGHFFIIMEVLVSSCNISHDKEFVSYDVNTIAN